uniref:Variant Ionotropic Glutamate Receptor n=1 Tax=Toxocara canis TaxID=6265 RepID=A0A183U648_TOXCA
LLSEYCRLWRVYYQGTTYIHNLFGYLNKQYVKSKGRMEIEGGYGAYSQFITQSDVKEIGLVSVISLLTAVLVLVWDNSNGPNET